MRESLKVVRTIAVGLLALVLTSGFAGCAYEEDHVTSHPTFPCGPYWYPMYAAVERHLQWTPDESHLVFFLGPTIHVVNAEGTSLRTLADANPARPTDYFPFGFYFDISPNGKRIVYATCEFPSSAAVEGVTYSERYSERGRYHYEIAVINLDGSGHQRLTNNQYLDHYPVWSVAGMRITFIGQNRGPSSNFVNRNNRQLYSMAADGSNLRHEVPIEHNGLALGPPMWSPNGEFLAILVTEGEFGRYRHVLYVLEADTLNSTRVAQVATAKREWLGYTNDSVPVLPSWSPDGAYLAFAMADESDGATGVYTVRPDGSELKQIFEPQSPEWETKHVSWSPDGSEILVVSNQTLFFIQPDGIGIRSLSPITEPKIGDRILVAWSPHGTRLALYYLPGFRNRDRGIQLYTVSRDGTDRRELVLFRGYVVAANSDYRDESNDIAACSEGFVVSQPQESPGLVQDCQTLLVMRDRLSGDTIWNWRAEVPITEWWGVEIGGSPPRVVALDISSIGGIIPPEIGNLIHLEKATFIGYKGSIPAEMGKLVNLRELYALEHRVDGHFADLVPVEMGKLTNLEGLELRLAFGDKLTGCVPAELPEIWVEASYLNRCKN